MSKVIIFGLRDIAELAHFYLTQDSSHEVIAFCVDRAYLPKEPTFKGLPVVAFEEVEKKYPSTQYDFFAPMSPKNINQLRKAVYLKIKEKGYQLISYVSSKATTFSDLSVGENCFILEDNTLQPFVKVGHNVVMWSGNHIGHHSHIQDHVFITSHVVLSGHSEVGESCFLGVNAAIRNGLKLAEGSLIAMGAVLTHSTEPWSIYKGNPAKKQKSSSQDANI